jgi:hypothetical protein
MIGGDTQVVYNIEYRIPIVSVLTVAAFADVGQALKSPALFVNHHAHNFPRGLRAQPAPVRENLLHQDALADWVLFGEACLTKDSFTTTTVCRIGRISGVKQAVRQRQQMSWSRRGAQLLLQVRTRALNEEIREKFDEWYPGFNAQSEGQARAA